VKAQCPSMRTILMRGEDIYNSENESVDESVSENSES